MFCGAARARVADPRAARVPRQLGADLAAGSGPLLLAAGGRAYIRRPRSRAKSGGLRACAIIADSGFAPAIGVWAGCFDHVLCPPHRVELARGRGRGKGGPVVTRSTLAVGVVVDEPAGGPYSTYSAQDLPHTLTRLTRRTLAVKPGIISTNGVGSPALHVHNPKPIITPQ